MAKNRKWTAEEDSKLLAQVKANPQNLTKCFLAASMEIDRSPHACASRWYLVVSKDPKNAAFLTVSIKHKCLNRKNGKGEPVKKSIFKKILEILGWN